MNRRKVLQSLGILSVLAVGGSVLYAQEQGAFSVGEGEAYRPWQDWDHVSADGPLALVRAGILAASPHNTQPWRFRVTNDWIELYADFSRGLGAMDPYRREMHVGLGCALENMVLAGRAQGYDCGVVLAEGPLAPPLPLSGTVPVATLHLRPGPREASAHYAAIPHRHTNRGAYDSDRPVSTGVLDRFQSLAAADPAVQLHLLTTDAAKAAFAAATVAATATIIQDAEMTAASHRWFRLTAAEIDHHCDGVTLEGAGLSPLLLRLAKLLPGLSAQQQNDAWLATPASSRCRRPPSDCSRCPTPTAGRWPYESGGSGNDFTWKPPRWSWPCSRSTS